MANFRWTSNEFHTNSNGFGKWKSSSFRSHKLGMEVHRVSRWNQSGRCIHLCWFLQQPACWTIWLRFESSLGYLHECPTVQQWVRILAIITKGWKTASSNSHIRISNNHSRWNVGLRLTAKAKHQFNAQSHIFFERAPHWPLMKQPHQRPHRWIALEQPKCSQSAAAWLEAAWRQLQSSSQSESDPLDGTKASLSHAIKLSRNMKLSKTDYNIIARQPHAFLPGKHTIWS